jgi:cellulose synthase/poly-beta-1,6-N-acetylglucosamine synthase-like glycosyltransferase
MTPLLIVVSAILVAFDFQNLLAWWHGKLVQPGERVSWDFTVIVPLFGDPKYFAEREAIAQYRSNVLVALEVSSETMAAFADELEAEGWQVSRLRMEKPNPAGLVKAALPDVTTTWALRLDADTGLGDGLQHVIAAVAAADADLCSVKVDARNRTTIAAKLQGLEYRMAMLSRHYRPWLTSGACFIGKTESLRLIFEHHSLWTPGEDIETGRIAHALKMRIRHAAFVVETDVPETWPALFHQRRLWWAGTFRHFFVNADRNLLHLPVLTGYMLISVYATIEFKWWGMINWHQLPREMPLVLAVYAFVTLITNLQVASPWMIVFPLYSLAQTLVLPPLGVIKYVQSARRAGRLGRYRFGYRRGIPRHVEEARRLERIQRAAAQVAAARGS